MKQILILNNKKRGMSTFIIEIVLAKIKTIIYPPRVSNPCRSKISIVVILYFFSSSRIRAISLIA